METELTKEIKRATHFYAPKMNAQMRTIRYADEVWTPNGIVDSIRFEDYIDSKFEECKRINYETYLASGDKSVENVRNVFKDNPLGNCKIQGETYPNKQCKGCFYKVRKVEKISMMITAFEVKITKADFKSENGHNIDDINQPIGNENYYCVPKELVKDIEHLVPEHVGILAYYGSGRLKKVKPAKWLEVPKETQILLLYNALKKWCDKEK